MAKIAWAAIALAVMMAPALSHAEDAKPAQGAPPPAQAAQFFV